MKCSHLKRGFSLVELMIALGVFSILALGVTSMTLHLRQLSDGVVYRKQALETVQNYAEQIRTITYSNFTDDVELGYIGLKQSLVSSEGQIVLSDINIPISTTDSTAESTTESTTEWLTIGLPLSDPSGDYSRELYEMEYRIRAEVVDASSTVARLVVYEVDLFYEYKRPNRDDWASDQFRVLVIDSYSSQ
jgi:prepilin-type N-terminal cleavage/methylation domain-containing protein